MIILTTTDEPQKIKFIGRKNKCDKLILRDEQDNTETVINAYFEQKGYYLIDKITFDLKEGRFYNLTAFSCDEIIYRDKIFCTDNEQNYSINDLESKETNNDYISL